MNDSKINLESSIQEETKLNGSNELVQARKEALKSLVKDKEEGFKWLNEDSRNFLGSGYLSPGVSAVKVFTHWHHQFGLISEKKEDCQLVVLVLTYLMIWVIFYILNLK